MDWKLTIKTLVDRGLTQVAIAERCGVAQATISDLSRGITKSPAFELGSRLVTLLAETKPAEVDSPGQAKLFEGVQA